jgi:uncharacterized protein YjiS (DUF1127 family)
MAYVSSKGTASSSVTGRLAEMGREAVEAYQAWRIYRRTLDELRQLSPRELDDLGLSRAALRQAAHDAAYGKAR